MRRELTMSADSATRLVSSSGVSLLLVEAKALSLELIAASAVPIAGALVLGADLARAERGGAIDRQVHALIGRTIELTWSELVKACPVCRGCGRWNYHLASCPARAAELVRLRAMGVLR